MKESNARIELRVTPKEKDRIKALAKKCGLSTTEYLTKRALGYEPSATPPEAFFSFYRQLCDLTNAIAGKVTPETEQVYLNLAEELHDALLGSRKG